MVFDLVFTMGFNLSYWMLKQTYYAGYYLYQTQFKYIEKSDIDENNSEKSILTSHKI